MSRLLLSTLFFVHGWVQDVSSFSTCPYRNGHHFTLFVGHGARSTTLYLSDAEQSSELDTINSLSEEKKKELVGNLVEDDEWNGVTMELSELVRMAVIEDVKKNAREFLGKENYEVGDISKEIDSRVKTEVAKVRGKEKYELGDFAMALDEISKSMTEEMTGKPYEPGDLSKELDSRIKTKLAKWSDKPDGEYELFDLSKAIDKKVKERVEEMTGKPYEFGDVSRMIEDKRREWVKSYLGEEKAKNYQFGDITKKALSGVVGKDYEFGDVTKQFLGNVFGSKKKKDGNE